jgi:hypothetical protein
MTTRANDGELDGEEWPLRDPQWLRLVVGVANERAQSGLRSSIGLLPQRSCEDLLQSISSGSALPGCTGTNKPDTLPVFDRVRSSRASAHRERNRR